MTGQTFIRWIIQFLTVSLVPWPSTKVDKVLHNWPPWSVSQVSCLEKGGGQAVSFWHQSPWLPEIGFEGIDRFGCRRQRRLRKVLALASSICLSALVVNPLPRRRLPWRGFVRERTLHLLPQTFAEVGFVIVVSMVRETPKKLADPSILLINTKEGSLTINSTDSRLVWCSICSGV